MNAPGAEVRLETTPTLAGIALALLGALLPDPADPAPAARLLLDRRRALPPSAVPAALAACLAAGDGADARLAHLARALSLDAAELLAAALALAVETEPLAAAAVAHLQAPLPHARPTLGLLAQAFQP
ncbi:MAG TPA: hypothetical protein VFG47_00080, partial [Geminicoccaceae bacterium]|nr:hypothetical protein [Geminicoccaceae bacterium]